MRNLYSMSPDTDRPESDRARYPLTIRDGLVGDIAYAESGLILVVQASGIYLWEKDIRK